MIYKNEVPFFQEIILMLFKIMIMLFQINLIETLQFLHKLFYYIEIMYLTLKSFKHIKDHLMLSKIYSNK